MKNSRRARVLRVYVCLLMQFIDWLMDWFSRHQSLLSAYRKYPGGREKLMISVEMKHIRWPWECEEWVVGTYYLGVGFFHWQKWRVFLPCRRVQKDLGTWPQCKGNFCLSNFIFLIKYKVVSLAERGL